MARTTRLLTAWLSAVLVNGLLLWSPGLARAAPVYLDPSRSTADRVEDLLGQLTQAEKVGQMQQILIGHVTTPASSSACRGCFGDPDPSAMQSVLIDNHVGSLLAGGTDMPHDTSHSGAVGNAGLDWAETYNGVQAYAVQHSRLHMPLLFGVDAVHGFSHPYDAPLFPHGIGMGATWDTALAERGGAVTGDALRATGWLENFAPVQDIYRDNRWGRAYEPWSEEPSLAGALGAANVRGLQAAGSPNALRVAATLKHFAGNSGSINGHDRVVGQLPLRYLQDMFLPPYKDAIDAGAKMVMLSSSSINGVPATASHVLQTSLLRERLGFDGVIISDFKDVQAIQTAYHAAPDLAEAIARAVNAGLDMAMWADDPDQWQANIQNDIQAGRISQARIDDAVRRILTLKFDLGLFEQPCVVDPSRPCVDAAVAAAVVQAGRDATLQAARESITLLKNAGSVLPLSKMARVLVTGPNADSLVGQLGGWSVSWQGLASSGHVCCEGPPGQMPPGTTVRAAMLAGDANATFLATSARVSQDEQNAAVSAASSSDVVVVVVGELAYAEGLGDDPAPALPADQKALVAALENTQTPVVVVVMSGRPLGLGLANEQQAAALLMAYQGSTEAGQAVAEVVFGDVNPSGKLPISWPSDTDSRPPPFGAGADFNSGAPSPLGDQPKVFDQPPSTAFGAGNAYNPLFSFGFGLSYTTFATGGLSIVGPTGPSRTMTASFSLTNTGPRAGTNSVPVFVSQAHSQVVQPAHRLVGFARVALEAGESQTLEVGFPLSRLAVTPGDLDATAAPEIEPGTYTVEVPTQVQPNTLFPTQSPPLQADFTVG